MDNNLPDCRLAHPVPTQHRHGREVHSVNQSEHLRWIVAPSASEKKGVVVGVEGGSWRG